MKDFFIVIFGIPIVLIILWKLLGALVGDSGLAGGEPFILVNSLILFLSGFGKHDNKGMLALVVLYGISIAIVAGASLFFEGRILQAAGLTFFMLLAVVPWLLSLMRFLMSFRRK